MTFVPENDRKPVAQLSARELLDELVADAVAHHPTFLPRFVAACDRIGKLEKCGPEEAYLRVIGEVEALTGERRMPMWA